MSRFDLLACSCLKPAYSLHSCGLGFLDTSPGCRDAGHDQGGRVSVRLDEFQPVLSPAQQGRGYELLRAV